MPRRTLAALVSLLVVSAPAAAVPPSIAVQGQLRSAGGTAVDGTYGLEITLYSDESGTTVVWSDKYLGVVVKDGVFSLMLGSQAPIDLATLAGHASMWLAIKVDNDPELPLQAMRSVPYAIRAFHALQADALTSMGPGSGLDADLLDGKDLSEILMGIALEAKQDQILTDVSTGLAPLAQESTLNQAISDISGVKAVVDTLDTKVAAVEGKVAAIKSQLDAMEATLTQIAEQSDHRWVNTGLSLDDITEPLGSLYPMYNPDIYEFGLKFNTQNPVPVYLSQWNQGWRIITKEMYVIGDTVETFARGGIAFLYDTMDTIDDACTDAGHWYHTYWALSGGGGTGYGGTITFAPGVVQCAVASTTAVFVRRY